MSRFAMLGVAAVAAVLFILRELLVPSGGGEGKYLGYIEGVTTMLSSPVAGRLIARNVERGQTVKAGTVAFSIDPTAYAAEVQRSEAAVTEALANLDNIRTGKRPLELDVIRQQREQAEAQLRYAEQDLSRATDLMKRGFDTQSRFDQTTAQVRQLKARVAELKRTEEVGELPGRDNELKAAEERVAQAKALLAQAKSHLADLSPAAPDDALVNDTYFEVGEWVGAGQPVVSLLAPKNVRLRFFVPQSEIARAVQGGRITFSCDGCSGKREAIIDYVAPRTEFTPPVIYSNSAREKLVFMVEAKPVGEVATLHPGLPVDVDPLPAGAP